MLNPVNGIDRLGGLTIFLVPIYQVSSFASSYSFCIGVHTTFAMFCQMHWNTLPSITTLFSSIYLRSFIAFFPTSITWFSQQSQLLLKDIYQSKLSARSPKKSHAGIISWSLTVVGTPPTAVLLPAAHVGSLLLSKLILALLTASRWIVGLLFTSPWCKWHI